MPKLIYPNAGVDFPYPLGEIPPPCHIAQNINTSKVACEITGKGFFGKNPAGTPPHIALRASEVQRGASTNACGCIGHRSAAASAIAARYVSHRSAVRWPGQRARWRNFPPPHICPAGYKKNHGSLWHALPGSRDRVGVVRRLRPTGRACGIWCRWLPRWRPHTCGRWHRASASVGRPP